MAKSKDLEKRRVITPEFRVSYPSVFEKSAYEDGTPEYSVTALFSKKVDMTAIKKAAQAAAKEKWGAEMANWPDKKKQKFRWPWRDGDVEKPDSPEYEGCYFIKFSSKKTKPGIVTASNRLLTDEEEFYAGCYARAEVVAYAYEKSGNLGVSFDLWNLQKLRDGEPFSGRKAPNDVFDAVEDEADDFEDDELDETPPKKPSGKRKSSNDLDETPPKKPGGKKKPEWSDDDDDDEDPRPKKSKKPVDDDDDDDDVDFGF